MLLQYKYKPVRVYACQVKHGRTYIAPGSDPSLWFFTQSQQGPQRPGQVSQTGEPKLPVLVASQSGSARCWEPTSKPTQSQPGRYRKPEY